jgi:hypothetical protein
VASLAGSERDKLRLEPAYHIYEDLIKKINRKIRSEIEITLDFATGIQRKFLHGRLIAQKKVKTVLRLPPPAGT